MFTSGGLGLLGIMNLVLFTSLASALGIDPAGFAPPRIAGSAVALAPPLVKRVG